MRSGLALRVDAAGLVPVLLHRSLQVAVTVDWQHTEAAAGGRQYAVIGNEQVALVMAEAGMGRLIAQAWHLVQGLEAAVLANGKTADLAVAGAILVDRE
ncbi:hypothetical protein D9M71_446810 [compost metagenome]